MTRKVKGKKKVRAEPKSQKAMIINSVDIFDEISSCGYTKLSQNAEIIAGVNKIADLVGSMTIHLMQNTDKGDVRVKNGLSDKIDIYPNKYMTRTNFIKWIVRTMVLEGDGNAVVYPETKNGYIQDLIPWNASSVSFIPLTDGYDTNGYKILHNLQYYDPDGVLHFVLNPDSEYYWKGTGCRTSLKYISNSLKQANETKNGFMKSKFMPSLIIKVDAYNEEIKTDKGKRQVLDDYFKSGESGAPWLVPAEQFEVQEVRPLSLNDIALKDSVELDKRAIAAILGIPPFVIGIGEFKKDEWNNFINTKIMAFANCINQELSRKLLLSNDYYFKMNSRSLFAYDLKELSDVGSNLYVRGIMLGNEVRDWISLSPLDGLDERVILENYIPADMIGQQNKLKGGENDDNE